MDEVLQSGVSDALDRLTGIGEQPATLLFDHEEIGSATPVRTLSIGENPLSGRRSEKAPASSLGGRGWRLPAPEGTLRRSYRVCLPW